MRKEFRRLNDLRRRTDYDANWKISDEILSLTICPGFGHLGVYDSDVECCGGPDHPC